MTVMRVMTFLGRLVWWIWMMLDAFFVGGGVVVPSRKSILMNVFCCWQWVVLYRTTGKPEETIEVVFKMWEVLSFLEGCDLSNR